MPNITVTNLTHFPVYLTDLYITVQAQKSITTYRPEADLTRMGNLQQLKAAGTISVTLTFTSDEVDAAFGYPIDDTSPALAQATWFIDPANSSGVASDGNSGVDAAHPLKTWRAGVLPKLGTSAPVNAQNVVITFMSSQTDSADVVSYEPFCQRTTWRITGTKTQVATGVLGAVTAKNRNTGQVLKVNLSAIPSAAVGMLVANTTHASHAFISKSLGSGLFEITQPLTVIGLPASAYNNLPTEVDTWTAGDAITLYSLPGIFGGVFRHVGGEYISPDFPSSTLDSLHFLSPDGPSNSNMVLGENVSAVDCWFDQEIIDQSGLSGLSTIVVGCLTADVQTPVSTFFRSMYGGALVAAFGSILGWPTDLDVLLDASNGSEINLWGATGFGFQFGLTAVRGTLALTQNGIASFGGTARGASIIWGAGSSPLLYVAANYRLIYASGANKAVATFVGITLKINNQTSASAFNPTSGAFSAGTIALTAANLDTAFASSGFGGVAIVVGGGSITNQSD